MLKSKGLSKKTKRFAFFDVDDTVVSVKTMISFQTYWYCLFPNINEQRAYEQDMQSRLRPDASWEDLNKRYYSHFRNRKTIDVEICAKQWFEEESLNNTLLFNNAIVAELKNHQARGTEIVFVSGSFPEVIRPIAEHLNVKHILATKMETNLDVFTGEIQHPQTIGKGKAIAIGEFLDKHNGDASSSYAYGDDISDISMLESVGHPRVVRGGRGLEEYAKSVGWKILSPHFDATQVAS